mmetsp:Transcript_15911/g.50689  ORF Transcript_15911/g.50689 Transcript_15911/m.50689 type:complete len:227 (+) Transcript_15911:1175-1855(+)
MWASLDSCGGWPWTAACRRRCLWRTSGAAPTISSSSASSSCLRCSSSSWTATCATCRVCTRSPSWASWRSSHWGVCCSSTSGRHCPARSSHPGLALSSEWSWSSLLRSATCSSLARWWCTTSCSTSARWHSLCCSCSSASSCLSSCVGSAARLPFAAASGSAWPSTLRGRSRSSTRRLSSSSPSGTNSPCLTRRCCMSETTSRRTTCSSSIATRVMTRRLRSLRPA